MQIVTKMERVAFAATLVVGLFLGLGTQAHAQDDDAVRNDVYTNLNWSAGDSGYNEGALCGLQALEGIAGVQLPSIPFEENALGNIWHRVDMMNAAVLAYQLGYVDAAVNASICSQIHNDAVHQLLSDNPEMVEDWLSNR
jgi:hypothetical protein